ERAWGGKRAEGGGRRGTLAWRRDGKKRSLHYASLRSAPVGMTEEGSAAMKIVDVKAYPTSFRVPKERQVSLGIGTMTKRDCVMVKVTTAGGTLRWGERHHARSPGGLRQPS